MAGFSGLLRYAFLATASTGASHAQSRARHLAPDEHRVSPQLAEALYGVAAARDPRPSSY